MIESKNEDFADEWLLDQIRKYKLKKRKRK
jgi:hypothetical protein